MMFGVRRHDSQPVSPDSKIAIVSFWPKRESGAAANIVARFQKLKHLPIHSALSTLIDVQRNDQGRLFISSEYHPSCLKDYLKERQDIDLDRIKKWVVSLLDAIIFLAEHDIFGLNMSPKNLMLDVNDNIKVFNYGMSYITEGGNHIDFPLISNPKYCPPEFVLLGSRMSHKADIWALGRLLIDLCISEPLKSEEQSDIESLFGSVSIMLEKGTSHILDQVDWSTLPQELCDFVSLCIVVDPVKRADAKSLLQHPFLASAKRTEPKENMLLNADRSNIPSTSDAVLELTWSDAYYLWKISGGDPDFELRRKRKQVAPSIERLPLLVTRDSDVDEELLALERGPKVDESLQIVNVVDIMTKISGDLDATMVDNVYSVHSWGPELLEIIAYEKETGVTSYPKVSLSAREKDAKYQYSRIKRFSALLEEYPLSDTEIRIESKKDIPPTLRGKVWGALLSITGDPDVEYRHIDKVSVSSMDRQYNELLSSKTGHIKLKRILKAWILTEKEFVYWQGLDSVLAPFLAINFSDEALAWASFRAFVRKYSNGIFREDNSSSIKRSLSMFLQCLILFSELPVIDVERCVFDAIALQKMTPPSLYNPDRPHRSISTISTSDAIIMQRHALFLDLKTEQEFRIAHFHGAVKPIGALDGDADVDGALRYRNNQLFCVIIGNVETCTKAYNKLTTLRIGRLCTLTTDELATNTNERILCTCTPHQSSEQEGTPFLLCQEFH
ncbi:hypothetical protein HDV05_008357 [Chytridiales sp. JEL 0842]|nr:hypothetical protein HDV05_008357 [Chytridiales sp. JEL 0842]